MPHLKKKITKAKNGESQVKLEDSDASMMIKQEPSIKLEEDNSDLQGSVSTAAQIVQDARKPRKKPSKPVLGSRQGSKNIVKNYARAMSSFAYSEISLPYLELLADEENVQVAGFHAWIQDNKENIDGIERLRWLLIPTPKDSAAIVGYKRIFQKLCIIFLKFFSVNWIYGGKLAHKQVHLNYRFKMLRRIKNPEDFTYLK
jgi:hypothetical protein